MKKHFLKSFALLAMLFSALSMSAATKYCGEQVQSTVDNKSVSIGVTILKVGDVLRVSFESEHISGIRGGGTFQQWGNGVWANQDDAVANFKDGWTQNGTIWTKDFAFSTYPTSGTGQIYCLFDIVNAGAPPVAGFTLTDIDLFATCGETPGEGGEEPEPTPDPEETIIAETYFAPNWVVDPTSSATYDANTGAITVDLKSQFYGQWQAQVKVKHDMDFEALKKYQCSVKFHATAAVNGVTLKIDDNTGMVYEEQTINIPANEDFVYTSAVVNGVPGNNKIMVFDFGWAAPCQITISDISIQEVVEQVQEGFEWDGTAIAIPSTKSFGTFQGRLDLYNIVDGYAGTEACGKVDLYVVTCGNDMLYKAKLVNNQFIDNGTGWRCQLRTKNAELSDGVRETWAIAATDDGTTRYTLYGNLNNAQGLNGYGETFKLYSYMTVKNCAPDERSIETLTYTRDHINNPISDNTAPTLPGAANVTSTAENVTIALPAVTSEEVFYMIKDEAHNKQYISLTPAFVLPQDGSGVTYTYSCYAVDFNGNMSTPLTAEVSMAFNATSNLALNKPCQAGFDANNMEASKANDGNTGTRWASGGGNNPTDAWWYVDLGESYNLSTIEISWEGAYASDYVIMGSDDYIDPTNATAWQTATTLVAKTTAPTVGNNTQEVYSVTGQHARYLRLQANTLANNGWGCSFWEFRVFGTGVYDPSAAADTEKPVITSATPKTPIAHNKVEITMVATDNVGIVAYEVSGSGVSATCVPVDNVITVSNLQEQTTYNLTIVAVDAAGNKSDAFSMSAFSTTQDITIPHVAAPVPTHDAEDVIAFYSDNYTPVVNLWGKSQWNAVTMKENNISTNKYLYYTAGNWWGWEFGVNAGANKEGISSGVDCSEMEYLHIDVWGYENGTIRVMPIWGGTNLAESGALATNDRYYAIVEIIANQWNSIDIPLTTGFQPESEIHDFSSIFQFKFAERTTTAVAIDNVYFWKSAGTAPVESITLDKTTATIEVDEALQLNATVLPVEAANKNVIWTSSNTSVAAISAEGLVTGLTPGTTTITAASEENDEIKATCEITVEPITAKTWWGEPTTIKIEGVDVAILYSYTRNENKTITYSVIFDNPASAKRADINVNVADVYNLMQDDGTGNNTAFWTSATTYSKGEKITGFWYIAGNRINFDYIVGSSNERPNVSVASVVLDQASCSLLVGETVQLTATINPGTAANKTITWSSNNESVATVNNGLVTAKSAGNATITVTTQDGNKTASCIISVVAALTDVTYHANAFFIENGRYVGVNYSITRTAERKLHYEVIVNGTVVGLVMQVNDGDWRAMAYDANTKVYSYTSESTYTDGDVLSGFFYPAFAGGANRWDFTYTVGSTNSPVRTKVAFNDTQDPQTILTNNLSQTVDVIVNRSLVSGMYNTICLPFSLPSLLGTDLAGATLVRFLNAEVVGEGSNRELTLYFTPAQSIEAGVPYLIIPATDIAGPMMFNSVTIACTEATTSGSGDVIYQGILAPTELTANDYNSLFLISNNQLAWPEVTGSMNGMRGYFKVSPSTASLLRSVNARARIQLQENQTTSLPSIEEGSDMVKFIRDGQLYIQRGTQLYNAQGQLVE